MRLNFFAYFYERSHFYERHQTLSPTKKVVARMSYLGVYDRTIFYNPTSKYCINMPTASLSFQSTLNFRHLRCSPLAAGEERRDVADNKAQTV